MVYTCCVLGCKSGYRSVKSSEKIGLYQFPKDGLRERWLKFLRRKNFVLNDSHRVCAKHFLASDFQTVSVDQRSRRARLGTQLLQRVYLKKDAVPSLLPVLPGHFKNEGGSQNISAIAYTRYKKENHRTAHTNIEKSELGRCGDLSPSSSKVQDATFRKQYKIPSGEQVQFKGIEEPEKKIGKVTCTHDESDDEVDWNTSVVAETSPPQDVEMVYCCNVPTCVSNSKQMPHLGYHKPPRKFQYKRVYRQWLDWMKSLHDLWEVPNKIIPTDFCVCSAHFRDISFIQRPVVGCPGRNVILRKNASPCIHPLAQAKAEYLIKLEQQLMEPNQSEKVLMDMKVEDFCSVPVPASVLEKVYSFLAVTKANQESSLGIGVEDETTTGDKKRQKLVGQPPNMASTHHISKFSIPQPVDRKHMHKSRLESSDEMLTRQTFFPPRHDKLVVQRLYAADEKKAPAFHSHNGTCERVDNKVRTRTIFKPSSVSPSSNKRRIVVRIPKTVLDGAKRSQKRVVIRMPKSMLAVKSGTQNVPLVFHAVKSKLGIVQRKPHNVSTLSQNKKLESALRVV